jgi:hypothetical protein
MNNFINKQSMKFRKWWIKNIWKPSWTKLTAAIYGIPSAVISLGEVVSKYANDPIISKYLTQLNVPYWVTMLLAGIALIHYIASGRD